MFMKNMNTHTVSPDNPRFIRANKLFNFTRETKTGVEVKAITLSCALVSRIHGILPNNNVLKHLFNFKKRLDLESEGKEKKSR